MSLSAEMAVSTGTLAVSHQDPGGDGRLCRQRRFAYFLLIYRYQFQLRYE